MKKFFYCVEFSYTDGETSGSFDLGTFSSLKNARKKIDIASTKNGFAEYEKDNFHIFKVGVDFDQDVQKENANIYCLSHEYYINDSDAWFWTIFGYFSSYEKAQDRAEYLKKHTRIGKKYPENFEINNCLVDNFGSWSDGFEKYDQ